MNEEEWYLHTEDQVKLFVHEFGKGEIVVGLHGGYGAEHSYMIDFLAPLQEDFRFVLFDQRGALRSPIPDSLYSEKVSIEKYVEDLEQLREELGLKRLKLIAHSMGAHYAYEYLSKYPKNVEELIVISGFLLKWPDTYEMKLMSETHQERARFMQRKEVRLMRSKIENDSTLGKSKRMTYLWKLQYATGQIFNLENWKLVRGGGAMFNPKLNPLLSPEKTGEQFDFLNIIKNHSYEVHYIFGYHEFGDYGVRLHQKWLNDLDHVILNILEESGHAVWLDKPIAFQNILKKALTK